MTRHSCTAAFVVGVMTERGVWVVSETPSLGRCVVELLESAGVPVRPVQGVAHDFQLGPGSILQNYPVLVTACNEMHCETARRWRRGEFPGIDLVVVGARDPTLASVGRLHVVRLPLVPAQFISLIGRLLNVSPAVLEPLGGAVPATFGPEPGSLGEATKRRRPTSPGTPLSGA
ncbi:MAG: hypothetical protein L3J96_00680 [Thermoplasmata archaeon]|nr:hypothetical protein [Thermoplasmata archaeon]